MSRRAAGRLVVTLAANGLDVRHRGCTGRSARGRARVPGARSCGG
ncbi:MAG: hypothetical protein WDN31_17600 [Hyphomicrobium sp.]